MGVSSETARRFRFPEEKVILTLFLHHSRPVAVSAFSQLR